MKRLLLLFLVVQLNEPLHAEDGYRLWLRYDPVDDPALLATYRQQIHSFYVSGKSPTIDIVKKELKTGLEGLLNMKISMQDKNASVMVITGNTQTPVSNAPPNFTLLEDEGFSIVTRSHTIIIAAKKPVGALYGIFYFLRLIQTHQDLTHLSITSAPKIMLRLLNHWDNLNRHVERGYAGISIFNWHTLPGYIDQRYIDYARANASIGINGTVLTNVNANALVLTPMYLEKVQALANVFRPYGIRVYLTARFSAPVEIGGLSTADPLDAQVQQWWKNKADEIYRYIPDFGGFLVKANSEGQPGPQNYGRTHADGANMLADAVTPHGGIVMWRAFVYSNEVPDDRVKQASNEFQPLDGKFRSNVLVQVKNGPLDFQPREPFHPLFGAMPKTPLMLEFQITQEYLGQGTHLVYEAPLFKEVMDADTYRYSQGSTVSKIITGESEHHELSGIAGVSNIGNERNWTGHLFGQANWYAYGRLAWDPDLSASAITDEWIRQTFSNKAAAISVIRKMMLSSRDILVGYMTPLGLHHIMGTGHHYGPAPWVNNAGRADWNPVYYHRADSAGIGFNRTESGSNAVSQYAPEVAAQFNNLKTCPEKYLLWFHHVDWNYRMKSGKTLWEELYTHYYEGVDGVREMQQQWNSVHPYVDEERFRHVEMMLTVQESDAVWWRNACLLYFQTFSHQPIPATYEKPDHTLEYYKSLRFPYAPGTGQ